MGWASRPALASSAKTSPATSGARSIGQHLISSAGGSRPKGADDRPDNAVQIVQRDQLHGLSQQRSVDAGRQGAARAARLAFRADPSDGIRNGGPQYGVLCELRALL